MNWSDIAGIRIMEVLKATDGQSEQEIKQALFAAYPFGERKYWPYKIWLAQIKRQRELFAKRKRWEQGMLQLETGREEP